MAKRTTYNRFRSPHRRVRLLFSYISRLVIPVGQQPTRLFFLFFSILPICHELQTTLLLTACDSRFHATLLPTYGTTFWFFFQPLIEFIYNDFNANKRLMVQQFYIVWWYATWTHTCFWTFKVKEKNQKIITHFIILKLESLVKIIARKDEGKCDRDWMPQIHNRRSLLLFMKNISLTIFSYMMNNEHFTLAILQSNPKIRKEEQNL